MKFVLTYDGELPASANKGKSKEKWGIRKQLDPQLRELWSTHPALRMVWENRHFPQQGGATLRQTHHQYSGAMVSRGEDSESSSAGGIIDLCENINKHGQLFRPLVRERFALHCGLKIAFLRNEPPGRIYQGGDLDGRIKTLLDALAMPQHREQVILNADNPSEIFCLLEDDSMISSLEVQTERLLAPVGDGANYVRLNIEVDVRVRQATIYNQSFLGS